MSNEINIRSRHHKEFSSNLLVGRKKYIATTDVSGPGGSMLATRLYRDGELVFERKDEVEGGTPGGKALDALISEHHRESVEAFKEEMLRREKTPSSYIEDTKKLLAGDGHPEALGLLDEAVLQYPQDPFLLSYHGCLIAIVRKEYDAGIAECVKAIKVVKQSIPFGHDAILPTMYLNLGRAYVAAGNKKSAVDIFKKGLSENPKDRDLHDELNRLGRRKRPPVPFLSRSNPINKYIGKLLSRRK